MRTIVAVALSAVTGFHTAAFAQRGVEVQAGAGYVLDTGEEPSVPAVNAGVVAWFAREWGIGVRLTEGVADDHYDPPRQGLSSTFLGPGDLRMWAITYQRRGFVRGLEVNLGVGVGGHGFRFQYIRTGVMRADGRIDPIRPEFHNRRSGSGFMAIDLLVGRHLIGPLHVKGGFTSGLSVDLFPFQPMVIVAFRHRKQ
jgi:hypothetical protein